MTGRVHDRSCGQSDSDSRDPAETANSPTSHGMEADHRRADIRARRVGRPCCSRERHQCQSGVGMAPTPCARPAHGRCDSRRNAAGCRQRTVSAVDGARGADCDRQHTVRLDPDSAWQDVNSHRRRAGPGRAAVCSRSHFTMIDFRHSCRNASARSADRPRIFTRRLPISTSISHTGVDIGTPLVAPDATGGSGARSELPSVFRLPAVPSYAAASLVC
ncbi:hypothetical protein LvStA_00097 [Burkholderia gladioli]|nr:hypothetical protein LvStA_00097 [Burkholderia gladioli]